MEQLKYALDHVAIPSLDIPGSVAWYVDQFGAEVLYQDNTWAFLKLGQGKVALITPGQHPPHIALRVDMETLSEASYRSGTKIDSHRDGTCGIYVADRDGNQVELICYPTEQTIYEAVTQI